jgi:hypothetical protein
MAALNPFLSELPSLKSASTRRQSHQTPLKQGHVMLTDTSLFTRAIRDLSGAVERINGRDVDRVVSCISNARHVSVRTIRR